MTVDLVATGSETWFTGDMTPTERQARQQAARARAATLARDEAIRRAHDEGSSLRAIAAATELTHTGVKKIIDRVEDAPSRKN